MSSDAALVELMSPSRDEDYWLRQTIYHIRMCFLPVVLLGTVTNVMNLFVLLEKDMRTLSSSVYLLALCLADLGVIYCELFRLWFEWMDFVEPALYFSEWYCRVNNYLDGVMRDYSNWILVCLTFERLIMVGKQSRARQLCTVTNAKKITVALYFILCLPHVHCVMFRFLSFSVSSRMCSVLLESRTATVIASTVDIVVSYLPVVIVLILNVILAVLLVKRNELPSTNFTKRSIRQWRRYRKRHRLAVMLMSVAIAFFVCETPRVIIHSMCRFVTRTASLSVILNISYTISGLIHSSRVWLYVVTLKKFHLMLETPPQHKQKKFAMDSMKQTTESIKMTQIRKSTQKNYLKETLIRNLHKKHLSNENDTTKGGVKIQFRTVWMDDKSLQLKNMKVKVAHGEKRPSNKVIQEHVKLLQGSLGCQINHIKIPTTPNVRKKEVYSWFNVRKDMG